MSKRYSLFPLRLVLATVAVTACTVAAVAQKAVGNNPDHAWNASWITSAEVTSHGESVLHFRKQFTVSTLPEKFLIYVSADNQFELHVNGKLVGSGPSRGDLQHWRYETYDIAPLLHPGGNLLAATIWNFGDASPLRQISGRTAFVLDGDPAVRTDESWQVEMERGRSTVPFPQVFRESYYAASPGELIDGSLLDWTWDQPSSSTGNSPWKPATIIAAASARGRSFNNTDWQLVADALPEMELSEQPSGRVVRASGIGNGGSFPEGVLRVPAHSEVTLLIDAGQLTTAYPELDLSGGKDATVKLTYAEALYDNKGGKANRNDIRGKHIDGLVDEVRSGGGSRHSYMPLDWRTWRYLQIEVKTGGDELELERLRTWFTAYPFKELGQFEADDASIKRIWEIGWRTARLCAHDTYMDTPYWERLQYTGDTRIETLISYVVTGDDRLPRQAIEAFHNSITSDGVSLSRYPSSIFQDIPGFSMYWVGMVHDYWLYRPDIDFVKAQLPGIRSTLDFMLARQNPNGLLGRLPWWPFVDWSDPFHDGVPPQDENGDSAVLSLQLVEALRYSAEMERALGNPDLARQDAEKADEIAAAVKKLCWSEEDGLLADTPQKKQFSQHANAYAVWLDVIPRADQQNVMTRILSASDAGFVSDMPLPPLAKASYYYRFYLARALAHAGMGDRYLELLGPWKTMIANGLTTWAEQPEPTRSDSHAWSSHPNYDLLTVVAGISPAEPGFKSVRIEPHLGKQQHVHAVMATPSGNIEVDFQVETKNVSATISLPAGLGGTLVWNGVSRPITGATQHFNLPSLKRE